MVRWLVIMAGEQSADNALLTEIRDLLVPIADHYSGEYEERQAARQAKRRASVGELLASPKRRAAWDLAEGKLSQREISKQSGLEEGATSRLFKSLRGLGAIEGDPPRRTMGV
jgi:hypothetical protein